MKRAVSTGGQKRSLGGSFSQTCRAWRRLAAVGLLAALAVTIAVNVARLSAKAQDQPAVANDADESSTSELSPGEEAEAPAAYDEAALAQGKSMFRSQCSGCHGGTARGGQGPDLTDDRWIHGNTDEDIKKVIENGVPRTTMKKLGDALSEEQIDNIIAYVRSLANPAGASNWLPYMGGDPVAGEQLFFDEKGQILCSTCHTVGGRGARIGPTLDRIAARRAPEYIMESILLPSKDISFLYQGVLAVTEDGRLISGIRVNESNFNLQIREQTGRFWSLKKRDLEEFKILETSIMPENHAEQLTVKQLHDLFAFLMTLE